MIPVIFLRFVQKLLLSKSKPYLGVKIQSLLPKLSNHDYKELPKMFFFILYEIQYQTTLVCMFLAHVYFAKCCYYNICTLCISLFRYSNMYLLSEFKQMLLKLQIVSKKYNHQSNFCTHFNIKVPRFPRLWAFSMVLIYLSTFSIASCMFMKNNLSREIVNAFFCKN